MRSRGAPGTAPLPVAARVLPRGVRGRARRGAAVRVRGAPDARRAVALRVPAARARLRRGAGADAAAAARTRATRSTTCAASRPRRSSRTRTRASARPRTTRSSARSSCRLLAAVAERCGGFDWQDDAFESAYAEIELSLFGTLALVRRDRAARRAVGRARPSSSAAASACARPSPGEVSSLWPEARGLMPPEFGRDVDRLCVLELSRELDASEGEPPDAAGELADAVSALRLATAGAIAAGPVVFERLDFRPLRISPLLPIAATQPRGEAIRLDALRGRLAADLRERLPLADDDRELAEALDRWELSLFADEPFRSGQVRDALTALLGGGDGAWAAAHARGGAAREKTEERAELLESAAGRARRARRARRGPPRARRDAPARQPRRARADARRDAARAAAAAGDRARCVDAASRSAASSRLWTASSGPARRYHVKPRHGRASTRLARTRTSSAAPRERTRRRACCERLERIEALDRERAPAAELLERAARARPRGGGMGAGRGRRARPARRPSGSTQARESTRRGGERRRRPDDRAETVEGDEGMR